MLNQLKNRNLYVMVALDAIAFTLSLSLAYATRFGFALDARRWGDILHILPWVIAVKTATFFLLGAYRGLWRYTSVSDAARLFRASALATLLIIAGLTYGIQFEGYPRSVFFADSIFTCFICGGFRLAIRLYFGMKRRAAMDGSSANSQTPTRLLIVGAGDAAEKLIRELQDSPTRYQAVCCLDDDHDKWGRLLNGVQIRGPISRLSHYVASYQAEEALIAIPSLSGARVLPIVELCKQSGVRCRILPPLSSLIDGRVSVKDVRDVAIEDLLGREPVRLDDTAVHASLEGACVMVTGAGGSIGSEIARQVARCHPRRLVLFEIGESPLFEINRELRAEHPNLDIVPIIGDIRQEEVVTRAFQAHWPNFVYHAAAYKHVPLMEDHPDEAVLNNIRGTRHLAEAARRVKTTRFVMISTDKAVRPSNIMGATKRLCELLVEAMNGGPTQFVAVRFGNVLGSNGSVIPIFQKQIAARRPITVTDPEMTRFFMTIPEAVHLVLRCGAMPEPRGLYILDMGTPIRIMDLARNMIRLSGLREGSDIPIVITGLRPGEKLHEELITYGEEIRKTTVDKVSILERTTLPIATTVFLAIVRRLEQVALSHDTEKTRSLLMQVIELDREMHEHKGHPASEAAVKALQQRWTTATELTADSAAEQQPGKRLLLVDDERFMLNTLGPALSRLGYRVDLAETKQKALELLAAGTSAYDVILCDLYLPDGTGKEILAEQRKRESKTPFILMTAYDSPRLDDILGSDTEPPLLFKPFRIQDLMTIIESETGLAWDLQTSENPDEPAPARCPPPAEPGSSLTSGAPQHASATAPSASPLPHDGAAGDTTAQENPTRTGQSLRVLIVDDSPLIRERIIALLSDIEGVEIVGQANSVAQATTALRQLKPDVMTLDLRLPDGNGINILKQIQGEELPTAAIVLTSYPYPQYETRARAAGAYAFLNKANDFAKITEHIQALISRRSCEPAK